MAQRDRSFSPIVSITRQLPFSTPRQIEMYCLLARAPDHTTGRQVFEMPSYVAHFRSTKALGDYCAKYNFINEKFAWKNRLNINYEKSTVINIGSSKKVTTAGTVSTPFRFKDETQTYLLTFHVLPKCIHDIILGKPFLKATRTFSALTNFDRRVKARFVHGLRRHHLLYLGDSAPRFQGVINGVPEHALADLGAKLMVMDEDYALSMNLPISYGNRTELVFADGSTGYTSGTVKNVEWEFGPGNLESGSIANLRRWKTESSKPSGIRRDHYLDFHILKNAPANVILSDSFLFSTNAYSEFDCFLIDDDEGDDDEAYLFAIDYADHESSK